MSLYNIPRLTRFLFLVVVVNVIIFGAFRVGFWWYFSNPDDPLSVDALLNAFFIGFKYDVRLSLLMTLPVFLLGWLKFLSPFNKAWARYFWFAYLIIVFALAVIFYITHYAYYAYLRVPLDATILRFFDNPGTSLLMVWQTYPVVWIVFGWLLLLSAYSFSLNVMYLRVAAQPLNIIRKRFKTAIVSLIAFAILFGIYGKISWYPLRWSDAYFSPNPFATAVTVNPVLHSYFTLKNKDVKFDEDATRQAYDVMADYLQVDKPDKDRLNYVRTGKPGPLAASQPNIVLVFLESFATYKTSLSKNPLRPTPFFESMAKDALYFDNYFVPHTGTARSVFTALTGLADVETHETSTRNPLIVNQHTIVNAFNDYEKFYFIGGSASWGNIRGLLSYNIPNLHMYEEGSYTSPRVDVWGISDLSLFREADKVLQQQKKPFFAVIQTSGNHRPYTIPEDKGSFQFSGLKDSDVNTHGFNSVKEFDSFRFMDYCVQEFIETARQHAYFDNTIFVFYGDHGIHAPAGTHTPKYEEQLRIQGLRVPLVIYAPKLIPDGKVIDKVASEVDLLPTIAGLAGNGYIDTTLGRDLLDERYDNMRYAFTVTHDYGLEIGLLDKEFYFRMNSDGTKKTLNQLSNDEPRTNVMEQFPDKAQKYEQLTRALFETDRYMRFHNERRNRQPAVE